MKTNPKTNAAAALAYSVYLTALHSKPTNENQISFLKEKLSEIVNGESATGAEGTGTASQLLNRDGSLAFTKGGKPFTESGKAIGTAYAYIITHNRELGKLWADGDLETAGPSCFSV